MVMERIVDREGRLSTKKACNTWAFLSARSQRIAAQVDAAPKQGLRVVKIQAVGSGHPAVFCRRLDDQLPTLQPLSSAVQPLLGAADDRPPRSHVRVRPAAAQTR